MLKIRVNGKCNLICYVNDGIQPTAPYTPRFANPDGFKPREKPVTVSDRKDKLVWIRLPKKDLDPDPDPA